MNDLNVKSEPTPTPQNESANPDKPMPAAQDELAGPNQSAPVLRDDFTDLDEPDGLPDFSESAPQSAKLGDTQPVDLATAWRQWLQLAMSELEDRCQDEASQYLQVFRYIDLDDSTYTSLETCGATTTLACPRPFLSIFWSVFMDLRRYNFHHGNRRETDCRLRLVTRVLRKLSVATTSPDPIRARPRRAAHPMAVELYQLAAPGERVFGSDPRAQHCQRAGAARGVSTHALYSEPGLPSGHTANAAP